MKKLVYIFIGMIFLSVEIKAQEDIHLSQFFASPISFNPATSGLIDGDVRIFGNYRTQWSSLVTPYKTTSFSVDAPIIQEGDDGNFFGIGINFFNDVAGDGQFKSTGYNLNLSYNLEMANSQLLSVGIKGGYLQRSIEFGSFIYSNQWEVDEFDLSRPAGETFASDKVAAIDLGAGVNYYNRINNNTKIYIGASVDHANRPNVSFLGAEEKYRMRYLGTFGGEFTQFNTNLTIMPNIMYMLHGGNTYINVGSDFKVVLNGGSRMTGYYKEVSFAAGAYYRYQDAVYLTGRFNYDEYSFGFSYDLNISNISKTAGSTGALEFMFSYQPFFTDRARRNKLF